MLEISEHDCFIQFNSKYFTRCSVRGSVSTLDFQDFCTNMVKGTLCRFWPLVVLWSTSESHFWTMHVSNFSRIQLHTCFMKREILLEDTHNMFRWEICVFLCETLCFLLHRCLTRPNFPQLTDSLCNSVSYFILFYSGPATWRWRLRR